MKNERGAVTNSVALTVLIVLLCLLAIIALVLFIVNNV